MGCFAYIKLLSFGGGQQVNNKSNFNQTKQLTQLKLHFKFSYYDFRNISCIFDFIWIIIAFLSLLSFIV